jgi:hypothetical protein
LVTYLARFATISAYSPHRNLPLAVTLSPFLPKFLPYIQPDFTGRMNGRCVATYQLLTVGSRFDPRPGLTRQIVTRTSFPPSTSVSPVGMIPILRTHLHIYTTVIRRTSERSLVDILSHIEDRRMEKYFQSSKKNLVPVARKRAVCQLMMLQTNRFGKVKMRVLFNP